MPLVPLFAPFFAIIGAALILSAFAACGGVR